MVNIDTGLFINTATAADRATATQARRALSALFASDVAGTPRAGVLPSAGNAPLAVTGTSTTALSFVVNPGYAVVTRSAAPTLGGYVVGSPIAVTVTLAAANASLPRYDSIFICQPDPEQGDSTHARIDVLQGTPSNTPQVPAASGLPQGSLVLANVLVYPAVTSASACSIAQVAPYTAMQSAPPVYATPAQLPAQAPYGSLAVVQNPGNGISSNALYCQLGSWVPWEADTTGFTFQGTLVQQSTITNYNAQYTTRLRRSGKLCLLNLFLNTGSSPLNQANNMIALPAGFQGDSTILQHAVVQVGYANQQGIGFVVVNGQYLQLYQYVPNAGGVTGTVPANTAIVGQVVYQVA